VVVEVSHHLTLVEQSIKLVALVLETQQWEEYRGQLVVGQDKLNGIWKKLLGIVLVTSLGRGQTEFLLHKPEKI
jgi:hypothetical protein